VAKNVDNVRVWGDIDSAVYVANKGTTAPTSPTTTPGTGWTELGWLGDDGLTETRDVSADQKRAWQGGALVRTVRSSDTRRFKCVAWETSTTTIALTRPGSTPTTTTGVTHTSVKAYTGSDIRAWIIDQRDGAIDNRKIIPQGEVVEMGDIVGKNGELVAYELTIECYPASDGTLYEEYTNDPAVAIA
jgi:hypothetical protein